MGHRFLCKILVQNHHIHRNILIYQYLANFFLLFFIIHSSENAGLLALTRVGSRRVVQISAGFMIFFSILGK
jgi:xanthine/uracil permease